MTSLISGLRSLGPLRLGAMAAVAMICFGLLSYLAMRSNDGPMALLYGDLDLREASQVIDQLDKAHIAHKTEAGGSRVLVSSDQVDRARLLLAKEGLPSGGSIGYEIIRSIGWPHGQQLSTGYCPDPRSGRRTLSHDPCNSGCPGSTGASRPAPARTVRP